MQPQAPSEKDVAKMGKLDCGERVFVFGTYAGCLPIRGFPSVSEGRPLLHEKTSVCNYGFAGPPKR